MDPKEVAKDKIDESAYDYWRERKEGAAMDIEREMERFEYYPRNER